MCDPVRRAVVCKIKWSREIGDEAASRFSQHIGLECLPKFTIAAQIRPNNSEASTTVERLSGMNFIAQASQSSSQVLPTELL